jgi:ankyrin repeat protein
MGNHVHVVEYLLSEVGSEVDLQSADSRGESLLDIAAKHGTGNSTT